MPADSPVPSPEAGSLVEYAFSEPVEAATAEDVIRIVQEWRESLINQEVQFSDPAWSAVHRLELLAQKMAAPSPAPAQAEMPAWVQKWIEESRRLEAHRGCVNEGLTTSAIVVLADENQRLREQVRQLAKGSESL